MLGVAWGIQPGASHIEKEKEMSTNNETLADSALYNKAIAAGVAYNGTSVFALLTKSDWELSRKTHRVVSPKKLARKAGATRGSILDGLRKLEGTPYIDIRRVTGKKKKNYTFEVRLLNDAEALAVLS